ncbi:hypothetical protein WJX74_007856 [Apatococcus lobatus]|uniref:Uncharacterized protein n=1 Tax=Apatococcus lobatus TaxID=904363 RepID=A0AAW1QCW3_9CHLO
MPGPRKRPRKPPAPRQQGVTAQEILITCQEVQPLLEGLQESVKAEIQRLEVEDHQLRQQLKLYQADEDHALARPDSSQIGQPHTSCGSTHGEAVQYKRPSGDCISDLLPSVNAAEPPLPDDANEPVSNNQEAGQHAVQRASAPLMTSATASLGRPGESVIPPVLALDLVQQRGTMASPAASTAATIAKLSPAAGALSLSGVITESI